MDLKNFKYRIEKLGEIQQPVTTIVIPAWNAESTIQRAVVSCLTQDTIIPYNIYIIDDHSKISVKQSLGELIKDPRVSILDKKKQELVLQ